MVKGAGDVVCCSVVTTGGAVAASLVTMGAVMASVVLTGETKGKSTCIFTCFTPPFHKKVLCQ